jgi:hypothetical protein
VGWPPGGPTRIADILAQENRFEAKLGGLEITEGIVTRPTQLTDGVVLDRGDLDGGEIPRAHQPRQWPRVTPVSVQAVARVLGHEGRSDDPAAMAWFRQIAREPGPTGSRFIDDDQGLGVGVQRAHELLEIGLPGADGAEVAHLSVVSLGDISTGNGLFMPIPSDGQCARVTHG